MAFFETLQNENIKYALWLIGFIIAIIFFTFAPLMTMVLSGTFIVLMSIYYSHTGGPVILYSFYLGAAILVLGVAGIYVPMVANGINSTSIYLANLPGVKQLLLYTS